MTDHKLLKRQFKKAGISSFESLDEASFLKLMQQVECSYNDNKNNRYMLERSLDISSREMRQAMKDLDTAYKEASRKDQLIMQQSRLAQMGEMISMIAHQWRQPLASVSATVNALKLKNMLGEHDQGYFDERLERISDYSQHLSHTIDDFRDFFSPDKRAKKTSLEGIVTNGLAIMETELTQRSISVKQNFKVSGELYSYANELKQVVLNILKNGVDILVERHILNPELYLEIGNEGEFIYLKIRDNGGGIDETYLEKIFDPYFTTKSKRDGTGLGLYMSKMIIEKSCGGELSVSNGSDGAIFKIVLQAISSRSQIEDDKF